MTKFQKIGNLIKASQGILQIDLEGYKKHIQEIYQVHQGIKNLEDAELQQLAFSLKEKAKDHKSLDLLLIEAYALVFETCQRLLGLSPYEVQLMGAIAMHQGKLVEMKTGEGKTLAAVFPVFLNALLGKGVHVMTFNDYLAQRDAAWMGKVYKFLGLSVAYIQEGMSFSEKRNAYNADITYGTAKEMGFDYLRSFIAYHPDEVVQRPFNFAIIDEADALLIDEARNPLVLAGDILKTDIDINAIAQLAKILKKDQDFEINKHSRNIFLTEKGIENIEKELAIKNLMDAKHTPLLSSINLAIHAIELLKKDIDYVVQDGLVKLVDELTGRIVEDRKWRNGLQTAVEAKENLNIQNEGIILNSITIQHFVLQYPKRAGMTATAHQSIEHFLENYGMKVVIIPPNKSNQRIDHPDEIFTSRAAKRTALLQEIKTVHQTGRPILVGTLTVKESEELASFLKQNNLHCKVLNAKNNALEASIIADAGMLGAITISTNMAGRGTDILLGGKQQIYRNKIIELGGLYVIGTNRHESERIDQQLRGRAGRQGDPGSSRFFISLEDDLMLRYKLHDVLPGKYKKLSGDIKIEDKGIRKFVSHIQKVVEDQSSEIRRTLNVYSNLSEQQRKIVQDDRQKLLLDDQYLIDKTETRNYFLKNGKTQLEKFRTLILFQYDQYWAIHLDELQQVKEGIYMVRFGGQTPLLEYQRIGDQIFQEFLDRLDDNIKIKIKQFLSKPSSSLQDLGIQKPSSTWTYVINDNPFGNKLATMLLNNSNIGFQVDIFSNFILFFIALFKKMKNKN